jgi:hypothetical protein
MSPILPRTAAYLAGALVATVAVTAFEIYVLGRFEPRWGRGGSFQVLFAVLAFVSVLATVGFGVRGHYRRTLGAKFLSAALGLGSALVLYGLFALHDRYLDGSFLSPIVIALLSIGIGVLCAAVPASQPTAYAQPAS